MDTAMTPQDMSYHSAVLGGERRPVYPDEPQAGYYRDGKDAVLFIRSGDGSFSLRRNGVASGEDLLAVWQRCAHKPIEYSVYRSRVEEGQWPEARAAIAKSDDLADDIREFATRYASFISTASIEEQSDADMFAGYVQQARELIRDATATTDEMKRPLERQIAEIRAKFKAPCDEIADMNRRALGEIAVFGTQMLLRANDPDYKFAAGKAGRGKTIALRRKEVFTFADPQAIASAYGEEEQVKAGVMETLHRLSQEMAIEEFRKTGNIAEGLVVSVEYVAV